MDEELPTMSLEFVSDCQQIQQHLPPMVLQEVVSGINGLHPFIELALLRSKISAEMREFMHKRMFIRAELLERAWNSSENSNDESVGFDGCGYLLERAWDAFENSNDELVGFSGGGDISGSNERGAGESIPILFQLCQTIAERPDNGVITQSLPQSRAPLRRG